MKQYTDLEIFLLGIEASGKKPDRNYSNRQVGIFKGVMAGMIHMRDDIPLKKAFEIADKIAQEYIPKWVRGELLQGTASGW